MPPSPDLITSDDVARHYDELDRFYRETWGEHVHHGYWKTGRESAEEAARAMVYLVIERARITPRMQVLDVGCGYGATARILARECGAKVVGVTISAAQQSHAEKVTLPETNPCFLVEDWLQNRRESESFDAVIAMESTEHMPDKEHVFAEMSRVLRPGGRLVVVAWLAANERTARQDAHLVGPICRAGQFAGPATPKEYETWMSAAGLRAEEARDISGHVSRTWPVWAWRASWRILRHPSHMRLLLGAGRGNGFLASTFVRIWLAYRLGAMRMVIFTASKPG